MEVDYQLYGEGEALLGWLNATYRFEAPEEIDGNQWLSELAQALKRRLVTAGAEVAHLKMTLAPDGGFNDLALVSLVNLDFVPEMSERLFDPVSSGQLVVNLRAEAAPEVLRQCLDDEMAERRSGAGPTLQQEHIESFRPGQPEPVYRVEVGAEAGGGEGRAR